MHRLRCLISAVVLSYALTPLNVTAADSDQVKYLNSAGARVQKASDVGIEVDFHLTRRSLSDSDLAILRGMDNIVSLNLKGTRLTGSGLRHLSDLSSLRILHLEKTQVDDEGVAHLAGLTQLKYLNLFGTRVTDASIPSLLKLRNLEVLYIWQTKISGEGVAQLKKSLPGLKVVRGIDLDKLTLDFPIPDKEKPPSKMLKFILADNAADAPKSKNGDNIEVYFENHSKQKIKIYWIGYGGELKLYGELDPGGKRTQNSYSNNTWLITDADDNAIGYFICIAERTKAIIPNQP